MPCFPQREIDPEKIKSKQNAEVAVDIYEKFTNTINLLLLGTGESGKTTILKQMKILHINGYSEEEKLAKIPFIKQNVHESIYCIIMASSKINPPVHIKNSETNKSVEYLLNIGSDEPAAWTDEYVDHVKRLWADPDIQTVFRRSNEYQLIDSAKQFLDKVDEIHKEDYVPTLEDILYCRITTTAITNVNFDIQVPKKIGGGVAHFCMFDVGGQRGHRKKWIRVFEGGVHAILFLMAASDFDQMLREDETVNRLKESLDVLEQIFWSRFVRRAGFIVFLNKQDLFKKKLESGRRIEDYFPDYVDYKREGSEYERAKYFLRDKVIKATKRETSKTISLYVAKNVPIPMEILDDREAYIHFTTATDTNNIQLVFEDVYTLILMKNIAQIL